MCRHRTSLVALAAAAFALLGTACGDNADNATDEAGTFPLLGTEGEVPDRPALAIKVDNTENGRPQAGLGQADIVYEELVEGGLTRLLAIYHSDAPDVVGPVRSARSTDVALLPELGEPLFAWSGANPTFTAQVEAADVIDVGLAAAPDAYQRVDDRPAPYDLDAHPDQLWEAGAGRGDGQDTGQPPPALFDYRDEGEDPVRADAEDVDELQLAGNGLATSIVWAWNDEIGAWERSQDGTPHEDSDGERIVAHNVLIWEVSYEDTDITDSAGAAVPEAVIDGTGDALLLTDGLAVPGRWQHSGAAASQSTAFTDTAGDPLVFAPGHTWVEVLPPGTASW